MKHKLSTTLALVVVTVALAASGARAQTVAPGPYYAPPSWDQTLPAVTRFIVLSNMGGAAVLDRETGLVWERSPSTRTSSFSNAQFTCTGLVIGNRSGWRRPAVHEMATLVDGDPSNISSPRLPPGHPFLDVQSSEYWSATRLLGRTNDNFVWVVNLANGAVQDVNITDLVNRRVWCVRGGQGVDNQ